MSRQSKQRNKKEWGGIQSGRIPAHCLKTTNGEPVGIPHQAGLAITPTFHGKVNRLPYDAKKREQLLRVQTGTFGKKGYVG